MPGCGGLHCYFSFLTLRFTLSAVAYPSIALAKGGYSGKVCSSKFVTTCPVWYLINMAQPEPFLRPDQFWTDRELRANQTVIHLGCGPGFFLLPAARVVGPHGHIIGVDIREDMLREVEGQARREGLSDIIQTIRSDLEAGPTKAIKSHSADWTLLVNILPQADPKKIIREAKRVTKPGGIIITVEWLLSQTTIGPPVANRITRSEILSIIDELKLKLYKTFSPSPYHYGLLIKVEN